MARLPRLLVLVATTTARLAAQTPEGDTVHRDAALWLQAFGDMAVPAVPGGAVLSEVQVRMRSGLTDGPFQQAVARLAWAQQSPVGRWGAGVAAQYTRSLDANAPDVRERQLFAQWSTSVDAWRGALAPRLRLELREQARVTPGAPWVSSQRLRAQLRWTAREGAWRPSLMAEPFWAWGAGGAALSLQQLRVSATLQRPTSWGRWDVGLLEQVLWVPDGRRQATTLVLGFTWRRTAPVTQPAPAPERDVP